MSPGEELRREDKPWFVGAVATLRYPGWRMAQGTKGVEENHPTAVNQEGLRTETLGLSFLL